MIDPCESANIILNQDLIDDTIFYPIRKEAYEKVIQIDTKDITISNDAFHCPEINLDILSGDGSPLNQIFMFNQDNNQLIISTDDALNRGDYSLMLIASFNSQVYEQTSSINFKVSMENFQEREYFEYEDLELLEFPVRQQWPIES